MQATLIQQQQQIKWLNVRRPWLINAWVIFPMVFTIVCLEYDLVPPGYTQYL